MAHLYCRGGVVLLRWKSNQKVGKKMRYNITSVLLIGVLTGVAQGVSAGTPAPTDQSGDIAEVVRRAAIATNQLVADSEEAHMDAIAAYNQRVVDAVAKASESLPADQRQAVIDEVVKQANASNQAACDLVSKNMNAVYEQQLAIVNAVNAYQAKVNSAPAATSLRHAIVPVSAAQAADEPATASPAHRMTKREFVKYVRDSGLLRTHYNFIKFYKILGDPDNRLWVRDMVCWISYDCTDGRVTLEVLDRSNMPSFNPTKSGMVVNGVVSQ